MLRQGYDNHAYYSSYRVPPQGYSPYSTSYSSSWYGANSYRGPKGTYVEEKPSQRSSNRVCIVAAVVVLVVILTGTGIGLGVYFGTRGSSDTSGASNDGTTTVADIHGELVLDIPFYADLDDPDSALYKQQEEEFCSSIDILLAETSLSSNYLGCTVDDFRNGSVVTEYTAQVKTESEADAKKALEVVETAVEQAVEENTLIQNVTVTKEKPMTVEVEDVEETELESCDGDFNGGCSHICESKNNVITCSCRDGYKTRNSNPNLCLDVNECDENLCQNDGECVNSAGSYSCRCEEGFTGVHCETDIDECENAGMCENGGTCGNIEGSYTCTCTDGYTGTHCENDIDECENAGMCENGGTCGNIEGSYTCTCTDGYTGTHCENDIDECENAGMCENGGTCGNIEGSYTCTCTDGYTGTHCENEITLIEGTMVVATEIFPANVLPEGSADFESISEAFCSGMEGIVEATEYDGFYEGCSVSEIRSKGDNHYEVDFQLLFNKILVEADVVTGISDIIIAGDADFGSLAVVEIYSEDIDWCDTDMNTCGIRECDHQATLSSIVVCKCEEEERWSEDDDSCEGITLLEVKMLMNNSAVLEPSDDVFLSLSTLTCNGMDGILEDSEFSDFFEDCALVEVRHADGDVYEAEFTLMFGATLDRTEVVSHISEAINEDDENFEDWDIEEVFVIGVNWCDTVLNHCEQRACDNENTVSSDIKCICNEEEKWDVEADECIDYTLIHGQLMVERNTSDLNSVALESDEFNQMSKTFCDSMAFTYSVTEYSENYDRCTVYDIHDQGADKYLIEYSIGFTGSLDRQSVVAAATEVLDQPGTNTIGDLIIIESFVEGISWCDTVLAAECEARGCHNEATYSSIIHCHCYGPFIWLQNECKEFHGLTLFPSIQSIEITVQTGLEWFSLGCESNPPNAELHNYLYWEDPEGNRLTEFTKEEAESDNLGVLVYTHVLEGRGGKNLTVLNTVAEQAGAYTCVMDLENGITFEATATMDFEDCNADGWSFCDYHQQTCYQSDNACDGILHCTHNADYAYDEYGCFAEANCSRYEFACPGYEHLCVPEHQICDGVFQCPGGADEQSCYWCGYPQSYCWSGECLYNGRFCDGVSDCADSSDEVYCYSECDEGFDNCPLYEGICIMEEAFCDGIEDCPQGTDEPLDCPCSFNCTDGNCIGRYDICDGFCDCVDQCEDEVGCDCEEDTFVCTNGFCTDRHPKYVQCNGEEDCRDGSDEEDGCECRDDQVLCGDQCLPLWQMCSGVLECAGVDVDELECDMTAMDASVVLSNTRLYVKKELEPGSGKHNYISDLWCGIIDRMFEVSEFRGQYEECFVRSVSDVDEGFYEVQYTMVLNEVVDKTAVANALAIVVFSGEVDFSSLSIINTTTEDVNFCKTVLNDCYTRGCNESANHIQCVCYYSEIWFSPWQKCIAIDQLALAPTAGSLNLTVQTGLPKFTIGCQTFPEMEELLPYLYWTNSNYQEINDYEDDSEGTQGVFSTTMGNYKTLIFQEASAAESGTYKCMLDIGDHHPPLQDNITLTFKDCQNDDGLYMCSDEMSCYTDDQVCDGVVNCAYHNFDRLDERDCRNTSADHCPPEYISCPGYEYSCIMESQLCDGYWDCPYFMDEIGCDMCYLPRMPCGDECYSSFEVCDGKVDCPDSSDEYDCHRECYEGYYNCPNYGSICIPHHYFCDGFYDCPEGFDERENCTCQGVKCGNGDCVVKELLCDGLCNCETCEDEAGCQCEAGMHVCENSYCTGKKEKYVHCNGISDCEDGSDEADGCTCNDDQFLCIKDNEEDKCVPEWQVCAGIEKCDTDDAEPDCEAVTTVSGKMSMVKHVNYTFAMPTSLRRESLQYKSVATMFCDGIRHMISQTDFADDYEDCHVTNIKSDEQDHYHIDYILPINGAASKEDVASQSFRVVNSGQADFGRLDIVTFDILDIDWCKTVANDCGKKGCSYFDEYSVEFVCICYKHQIWMPTRDQCMDFDRLILTPTPQLENLIVESNLPKFFVGCKISPSNGELLEYFHWIDGHGDIILEVEDEEAGNEVLISVLDGDTKTLVFRNANAELSDIYQCVLDIEGLQSDVFSVNLDFQDCENDADLHLCGDGLTCYTDSQACDGVGHCTYNYYYDWEDEKDCPSSLCNDKEVLCLGTEDKCILQQHVCDNYTDCPDDTDELVCELCLAPGIECGDGSKCLLPNQECDGEANCKDGTDEVDCDTECRDGFVNCPDFDGICIRDTYMCDGIADCPLNTDEEDCPCEDFTCAFNNTCLPNYHVCDGHCNCPIDCEDEYNADCECAEDKLLCEDGFCTQLTALYHYCDGVPDCPDASDEPLVCNCMEGQYLCGEIGNQTCVPENVVCSGHTDCPNNEDIDCNCGPEQFQCGLVCKDLWYWCNSQVDCPDGSDEANCTDSLCHPDQQFECEDGSCLPASYHCDSQKDCFTAEDEIGCEIECPPDHTNCLKYDGLCIHDSFICDFADDCPDGSDEENCSCTGVVCENNDCIPSYFLCDAQCDCADTCKDELEANCTCAEEFFQCDDGICTNQYKRNVWCDGGAQCRDGSDEPLDCHLQCLEDQVLCGEPGEQFCTTEEKVCYRTVECPNNDNINCTCEEDTTISCGGFCTTITVWCDGMDDCPDGRDEANCETSKCHPVKQFGCDNGTCFPESYLCDDFSDCAESEDEIGCPIDCREGFINCPVYTGICIAEDFKCDGEDDCPDGLDEADCPCTGVICDDGNCVQYHQLCDGNCDCDDNNCNDEANCTCPSENFMCTNGFCTFKEKKYVFCNGKDDCSDESDEPDGCQCTDEQFRCGQGEEHRCVAEDLVCSGSEDCPDNDDYECPCPEYEFQCDGVCVPGHYWCDGQEDCSDIDDESSCGESSCHPRAQYECQDGTCIQSNYLCDADSDCSEGEDERDCEKDCLGRYSFSCADGEKCIVDSSVCDYNFDCADKSDEKDCGSCSKPNEFRCNDGRCIQQISVCDHFVDCNEGEDEEGCPCAPELVACPENNKTCIPQEQFCDGRWDCPNGSDEKECEECHLGAVGCTSDPPLVCIHQEQVCDGTDDCTGGEDEQNCDNGDCSFPSYQCQENQCIDQAAFCDGSDDCLPAEDEVNCDCGSVPSGAAPFIVQGDEAAEATWPWQISLRILGSHICGGTLVSEYYIVTAAHCVEDDTTPRNYVVRMGTNKLYGYDSTAELHAISEIIMHPRYNSFNVWYDIAVLKLQHKVVFNDHIQPACLPRTQLKVGAHSLCYTSGWGYVNQEARTSPELLQNVQMKVWAPEELACPLHDHETQLCAGFDAGITVCSGDSGGPLVCLDPYRKTWQLRGVTSYTGQECNQYSYFAKVEVLLDWIDENTDLGPSD